MNDGMWVEGYFIRKDELPEELIGKAQPVKIRKFGGNTELSKHVAEEIPASELKPFIETEVKRAAVCAAEAMLNTPNTCRVATYDEPYTVKYEFSFYILAKGWGYRA